MERTVKSEWMCWWCFPHGVELGMVGPPNLWLIYDDGHYHLLWDQGHQGDEIVTFSTPPRPDPDPEDRDDASDELLNESLMWMDEADDALKPQLQMAPDDGECFMAACREGGYNPNGPGHRMLNHWLYHRCGLIVQAYEKENRPLPRATLS